MRYIYIVIILMIFGCVGHSTSIEDFLEKDWKQFSFKKIDKGKNCQKIWKYNESLSEITITNLCDDHNFDYVQRAKVEINNNRIISIETINGITQVDTIQLVSINDTIAVFKKMGDDSYIIFEKFEKK